MAALTQYQPYGLPGIIRAFVAKAAGALDISVTISATSSVTGNATRGGVPSGVDESVRNEFQFPYIPDDVPEDTRRVLVELRTMLEQQLLGNIHVGGALYLGGDLHAKGILFN